ncbi:MAG: hypothetical protein UZ21_OP11001000615 [Microgenomates bacterium OLB22]|nr:MAG: hypothetical protein UZ21_OP11001000615 [Microgenomates bacterium OLB22]
MSRPLSRYGYEIFLTFILLLVVGTIFYVRRSTPFKLPDLTFGKNVQSTNAVLNTFTGNKTGTTATIVFQTKTADTRATSLRNFPNRPEQKTYR